MRKLAIVLCAMFAVACNGAESGETDNSEGGSGLGNGGDSTGTGAGNVGGNGVAGSGGASSSSSGQAGNGGSAVTACEPTEEDPTASLCTNGCTCPETSSTEPEYCSDFPGICPEGGDTCSEGQNRCRFDMPADAIYEPPACADFVDEDNWNTADGAYSSYVGSYWEAGQLRFSFGNLTGSSELYWQGVYTMSGTKIYWNRSNADAFYSAEGEFNDNCYSAVVRYYKPGETAPYRTASVIYNHP